MVEEFVFGLEVVKDKKTRETYSDEEMETLTTRIKERGVLIRPLGSRLQIGPPLIVSENDADQIVAAIEACLAEM